uniref:Cysteine desulfurase n=1 Tax=Falco tinnunculus TaxID=100819 RepID=A0A8C4U0U3_FALTI
STWTTMPPPRWPPRWPRPWGTPCARPGATPAAATRGARESLARMVGARPEDIVFMSGGTEVGVAAMSVQG